MKCPQCQNEDSEYSAEYGILPGVNCQAENNLIPKPKQDFDFASPLTKLHRKEYMAEMYQPFVNGVLSKEYLDTYGTAGIQVSKEEIKNAKYVYTNMTRHHKGLQAGIKNKRDISKTYGKR